ncbi:hypothetical protein C0992_012166 [Termitomyces sp. T32_za158]|nr:hypothetical protein C0992_012166 [Termitomyces sp. T32_za158]
MASQIEDRQTVASMNRTADGNPLEIYCSTSFVGDLSYDVPPNQVAGMAHTLVTGRKTWKTSKGKNEAVWPAHIEAALFDGKINLHLHMPSSTTDPVVPAALEKYRPASSGDPKLLRRFPKRNRFISDHIKKVTGKERTPKQVGSRLQQLRDTCQEEKVLKLLSRREFPPESIKTTPTPDRSRSPSSAPGLSPSSSSTSTSPVSSPYAPEFGEVYHRGMNLGFSSQYPGRSVHDTNPPIIVVDFVSRPRKSPHPILPPHRPEPVYLLEFDLPTSGPYPFIRPDHRNIRLTHSGSLSSFAPAVKINCQNPLPSGARSLFCVFIDDTLHYNEAAELEALPGFGPNGTVQYGARLIPQYWATFCQQPDVMLTSIGAGQTMQEAVLCTVSYKLRPSVIKPEYPAHFNLPNTQQLGGPIYAPRPLLDAGNTLLNPPTVVQPEQQIWYDSCGMVVPPVQQTPSFDFLGVNEGETMKYLDDVSYIGHNWW